MNRAAQRTASEAATPGHLLSSSVGAHLVRVAVCCPRGPSDVCRHITNHRAFVLRWPCLKLLCQSHGMDALFAGSTARQEMVLDKKAPQHQSRYDGQPTEEAHHSQLSQAAGSDQRRQGEYASSLRRQRAFTRTAGQVPTQCRAGDVRARRVCLWI